MSSGFKQSLGLIRDLRNEEMYRFKNESNFIGNYLEKTSFPIDEQLMLNQERFFESYPFLRTYYCDCIAKKFHHEADLMECTKRDLCLCDFIHSCLDCIDRLMSSK